MIQSMLMNDESGERRKRHGLKEGDEKIEQHYSVDYGVRMTKQQQAFRLFG